MALSIGSNQPNFGIGGQNELDGILTLSVAPSTLSLVGGPSFIGKVFQYTPGTLASTGNTIADISSSAWQYLNVTNLSLIGAELTLFDMLDGITPAVGDKWRLPNFTSDGGQVVGFGNGRFQISQPTAGQDTMQNILYYDTSLDTWSGPQDATIQAPFLDLNVQLGRLGSRGNVIQWHTVREVLPANITTATSLPIRLDRILTVTGGVTAVGSVVNLNGNLPITQAAITTSGNTILLDNALLTLQVDLASLTLTTQEIGQMLTRVITQAGLAISAKDIKLYTTLLPILAAHAAIDGRTITLTSDANPLETSPGVLTAGGQLVAIDTQAQAQPITIAGIILGP